MTHFDHDLFISYAHIDDQPLEEGKDGWIAALHRVLEVRLSQLLGKKPRIWRDPKLQGNDYFDDTIVDELDDSAVLISIISPRYVQSDWCRKEAEAFIEHAKQTGGLRVGDKARVFKVVKTPVPLEQHPQATRGLLGYEFFELDRKSGRPRELGPRFGPDAERQYWSRLEDLAYDIRDLLTELEASGAGAGETNGATANTPESASSADAPKVAEGQTVFLAEVTHDLRDERDQVRRALVDHGHFVLPDQPLPLLRDELEQRLASDLERSVLAIHLIGRSYGVVPEGSTDSMVVLQNTAAAKRSAEQAMPRLIWMAPELHSDDERQQTLIETLVSDETAQRGADLLQGGLEELKTMIRDRLVKLAAAASGAEPPEPAASGDDRPSLLYLIADQEDQESVKVLEDYIYDQGFEVTLPLFESDESEARQDHQESLRLADAVLIYHGQGTEAWLRGKLRDLRKAPGFGRTRPFRATAVYVAAPETERKQRFRSREVDEVINALSGFDPQLVAKLMVRAKNNDGGQS